MASDGDRGISDSIQPSKNVTKQLSGTEKELEKKKEKLQAAVFLTAVTGIAATLGFGTTVIAARRQDPKYFQEGVSGTKAMTETGASLALRALSWGTLYAVTGCGILCYGLWKFSGASNAEEFKIAMGSMLPRISKNDPPQSRTEFEGLTDLLTYISEDWGNEKAKECK
ncbi:transmembrane protein 242 [Neodiprion virginianus]|uniref:transmembrane protein 242 n=1 Tax=Neodiprion fabricii TaxID=2872261 RepID=UPI001ED8EB0B|nr:transmembrane protein 242 [Neodiprion fabricii]XP_046617361.1 transmembrane protein 242 [Neodiprion virginianus]